jgi:hypothetical protein
VPFDEFAQAQPLIQLTHQQAQGKEVAFRGDACFRQAGDLRVGQKREAKYAIRLPANDNLKRKIAQLLTRPVGRAQAGSCDGLPKTTACRRSALAGSRMLSASGWGWDAVKGWAAAADDPAGGRTPRQEPACCRAAVPGLGAWPTARAVPAKVPDAWSGRAWMTLERKCQILADWPDLAKWI